MSQTKRHLIKCTVVRVLGDYGFDAESADKIAARITAEIYNLVPARVVSSANPVVERPAEIVRFQSITGYFPPAVTWDEIVSLMSGKTLEQLNEAYKAWCMKGNTPMSANWLKWIRDGNNVRKVVVS